MKIEDRIFSLIREYKHEIIDQYDLFERPEIEDWFYYEKDFTLNVCEDYENENNIVVIAYGVDEKDDFDSTDWDHVVYRKYFTFKEFQKL